MFQVFSIETYKCMLSVFFCFLFSVYCSLCGNLQVEGVHYEAFQGRLSLSCLIFSDHLSDQKWV